MEIRPILSAMMRNKTGAVLIALQIAITLAIVVNATFIIYKRVEFVTRPSGMDVDNIIVFQSMGFDASYDHQATVRSDLETLRSMPGVIAVTPASSVPLSNSGSANGFQTTPELDAPDVTGNYFKVDEQGVDALGLTLSKGRAFRADEISYEEPNSSRFADHVIITQAIADKLFPDTEALGNTLYDHLGRPAQIVGIIEHMHGSWVTWDEFEQVVLIPRIPAGPFVRYIVRTEHGTRDALMPQIETTLSEMNRTRIIRKVRSMKDVVASSYSDDRAMASLLIGVIILLVIITALGIVGLASFSVKQRTKQIGIRRAIGARKLDIIRYFMMENWLMTTFGVILGTVLAFSFNIWLVHEFELERLDPLYVPLGVLAIWILGLVSVFGPARKAASIAPAIATRTV